MTHTKTWTWAVLAGIAIVIALSAPATALEHYEFTDTHAFAHTSGPDIDVETVAGNATYKGIDGATETTVQVVIDVRADNREEAQEILDEIEIIVDGSNDYLDVFVDRPDNFSRLLRRHYGRERSISVSFFITGPTGARGSLATVSGLVKAEMITGPVDLSSVSGDIMVADVQDRVRAKSVSGQVSVTDCHADVRAEAVSGDVHVSNCGGDLNAETVSGELAISDVFGYAELSSVSGDIDAREIGGALRAQTTSGEIDVNHQSGDLELETVSGDIVARSESTDGILDASSHSGSVRLYANVTQIGKINLSTFSGDMRIDSDLDGSNALGRARGRGSLSLTLGDGRLYVDMTTHSGDIYVEEL
ncbi:MAG: DUF4097 family beta strand repeat protein [candidate division Zixibacteria bacterium]|nr:DUF4097 family beta strand repeat protein [candidate division Zixibacteria bacterium]